MPTKLARDFCGWNVKKVIALIQTGSYCFCVCSIMCLSENGKQK